jgi:chemotaxis regulatin CheY-phosphate phosphatase CheZ
MGWPTHIKPIVTIRGDSSRSAQIRVRAMPISDPPPGAVDYETIEAAVMETSRGRWFLAEYARRNRHAETEGLLEAMARIENVVQTTNSASLERVRSALVDMAGAIDEAKSDVAALKPSGAPDFREATEELDSVVAAAETATSDILSAAEAIQEIAWTMRDEGIVQRHCDALDARATDIYTACSFQDLTGQRTRKVIQVLRYLEARIDGMIALWGDLIADAASPCAPDTPVAPSGDVALAHANGSADISLQPSMTHDEDEPVKTVPPTHDASGATRSESPTVPASPLARLAALSEEQRIALFT